MSASPGKRRSARGLRARTSSARPPIQKDAAATWTKSASATRARSRPGSSAWPESVGATSSRTAAPETSRRSGGTAIEASAASRSEERDDRSRLGHPAEPGCARLRLQRQQPEAAAGDEQQPDGDNGRDERPTSGLDEERRCERSSAGEQHPGEEEQPQQDRGERRTTAGRERRLGRGQAAPDAERKHALDRMPVVRDHAPADRVGAPRKAGAEGNHDGSVVPAEPSGRACEHGGAPPVHGPDAARRPDRVVEEQPHVLRRRRQHRAVGGLRADEARMRGRSRRKGERDEHERAESLQVVTWGRTSSKSSGSPGTKPRPR